MFEKPPNRQPPTTSSLARTEMMLVPQPPDTPNDSDARERALREQVLRVLSVLRAVVWGGALVHEPSAPLLCAFPGQPPPDLVALFRAMGLASSVAPPPTPADGVSVVSVRKSPPPGAPGAPGAPVAVEVWVLQTDAGGGVVGGAHIHPELDTDALACACHGLTATSTDTDCVDLVQRISLRRFRCLPQPPPATSAQALARWVHLLQRCVTRVAGGWQMDLPRAPDGEAGPGFIVRVDRDARARGPFCSISQEHVPPGSPWVSLDCGHSFAPDPLLVWVATRAESGAFCPVCMAPVPPRGHCPPPDAPSDGGG